MSGLIWEKGEFWDFLVIVVILGGAGAVATGRALAKTWRPVWMAVAYAAPLAAFARFLQYALFGGTLSSLHHFLVTFVIMSALALMGFRMARARQMVRQYSWLNEAAGPLGWKTR